MTAPGGRLQRVYNEQEQAAINPFKTEYFNVTTPTARKTIAQAHIFPALFNYWDSIGIEIDDEEMKERSDMGCKIKISSFSYSSWISL